MITFYTDGSANSLGSAWAWMKYCGDRFLLGEAGRSGRETAARAEMRAAIYALESLPLSHHHRPVRIVTDYLILVDVMNHWITLWAANDWKTAQRRRVRNLDLWQNLFSLSLLHPVEWEWTPRNVNPFNICVDKLVKETLNEHNASTSRTRLSKAKVHILFNRQTSNPPTLAKK